MPSQEQIRRRLPSLYRPEPDSSGLLMKLVRAIGNELDDLNQSASNVLPAHWFRFADHRLHSPVVARRRELLHQATLVKNDQMDLADPAAVVLRMRDDSDPLTVYLRGQLSTAAQQALAKYDEKQPPSNSLQRKLIDALNRVVADGPLFDASRFSEVDLSAETEELIASEPQGDELVQLNMRLLEEAFDEEITPAPLDGPTIRDLGRIGALFNLSPWEEPPRLRESIEEYRLRIKRIVGIYRDGLGTRAALRGMIEAQLPVQLDAPAELRDRPFWLEEFAPLVREVQQAPTHGKPDGIVGPLMRWTIVNQGFFPVVPTVYVQGVQPVAGKIDATEKPLIELFAHREQRRRVGIAYHGNDDNDGTIAVDKTLRLRPAFLSWVALDQGLSRAASQPTESQSADPTAPGPWTPEDGGPTGTVVAIHQTEDHMLWVAERNATGRLWRYDGRAWTQALSDISLPNCLADDGHDLLIGTDDGLLRVDRFPGEDAALVAEPVDLLAGDVVYVVFRAADGDLRIGTSRGAFQLAKPDEAEAGELVPTKLADVEVRAIAQDTSGTLFYATELGVFQQRGEGNSYWFSGKEHSDDKPDWQPLGTELPNSDEIFLPAVNGILRGPDSSLWLATDNGMARYVAHRVRRATYQTRLEAFPELTTGPVTEIQIDARGLVWFCTDRGLLRFDGRDFWQFREDRWAPLGRADKLYTNPEQDRGAWRFEAGGWRRYNPDNGAWENVGLQPRTNDQPLVRCVFWTNAVAADLGDWDGASFTHERDVEAEEIRMHYKLTDTTITEGGIPAVPALPPGESTWRYLSVEPPDVAEPATRPAWTIAGRLLPPPPDETAAAPGRYDVKTPPPASNFDEAVFAFNPAARVWFGWEAKRPFSVLARLQRRTPEEQLDPAVLDRVFDGMQQVRPAGVRAVLAVEETIVRGA